MKPRAFTLIEQLAAVALSSLFMMAGFAVITRLGRDGSPRAAQDDNARAFRRAADLIEWDLSQAERFRVASGGVILSGFGSLDAAMNPTHRPVRVEYRVEASGGALRLLRLQTTLDTLSNRATQQDWVADNIARIDMVPLQVVKTTTRPATEIFGTADGPPAADAMKLVIVPADSDLPPVVRVCRLK